MIEMYRESVIQQAHAALQMFEFGLNQCDDERWSEPVVNMSFNQLAFHTLFFTDLYLSEDIPSAKNQPFHAHHASVFEGYEELKERSQRGNYERSFINLYLQFVWKKWSDVLNKETEASLRLEAKFNWLDMNRSELHFYNIRHVGYHIGQLSLLWQQEKGSGIPWSKQVKI